MKTTKKQQSGRSMIEMVGVLAVMGLITAAAFVLINSALASQRLSRLDDDVSGIVQGVRLLYNSQPDFNGVATAESGKPAGNSTLVLLGFGSDAKPYQNPYGGNYVLAGQNDARTFTVQITGLGKKTCTVLASRDWNGGGSNVATAKTGEVATNCSAETSNGNSVTVRYEKSDTKTNP